VAPSLVLAMPIPMPITEDDFGKPRLRAELPCRARGKSRPQHRIGATVADLAAYTQPSKVSCENELGKSHLVSGPKHDIDSDTYIQRRQKKTIYMDGRRVDAQLESLPSDTHQGVKHIDYVPSPQRPYFSDRKRCFDWTHRPTGYENPLQYDTLAENGHKRAFPELHYPDTNVASPRFSKAPHGSDWGGWARTGEPGRQRLNQPWDSVRPSAPDMPPNMHFCDARRKKFSEMRYPETAEHTTWRAHPKDDVSHAPPTKIHLNQAMSGYSSPAAGGRRAPAGLRTGLATEGANLQFYDMVRDAERTPHTAR